jgi:hypothetical protein
VFAGRDLEAGGTWLGLGRAGRFAGLTNFRDPQRNRAGMPSRGALVADFLGGHETTAEALARLQHEGPRYNAFNLFVSDGDTLGIYESESGAARLLEPGVHALSNHLLDTPWPKVRAGKARLVRALEALPDDTPLRAAARRSPRTATPSCPAPASAWPGSGCCRAPSSAPRLRHPLLHRDPPRPPWPDPCPGDHLERGRPRNRPGDRDLPAHRP